MAECYASTHCSIFAVEPDGEVLFARCFTQADAEQIVREHNAHEALVAALEGFVTQAQSYCASTGHREEGAAMFGACDGICEAIGPGRRALTLARRGTTCQK